MNRRLTPPPRVEPRVVGAPRTASGGIGWKTVSAFLVLGALTLSVFAFLPDWVTPRAPEPEVESRPAAAAAATAPSGKPTDDAVPEKEPEPKRQTPEPRPKPKLAASPSPPAPAPQPPTPVDPTEAEFTRAMSEGMAALNGQDFEKARVAFERARSLRPESREAVDAFTQADERIRLAAIAEHRERALALEDAEAWRKAEAEYDEALGIDATLLFAREGQARARERAELAEALAFHIAHPERLSDAAVLEEATRVLRKGESLTAPEAGPRHIEQLGKLESLIEAYSRTVVAEIRSDGLTEITVYRVGRLGSFDTRSLELRPGRYTVIGSRDGYRDVRRDLVIAPGETPEPLVVRCEEPIR